MIDLRVVDDEHLPDGHRWVRIRFPNGRTVTFVALSLVLSRGAAEAVRILPLAS